MDIVGPVAPKRVWSARLGMPVIEGSAGAPQHQKGEAMPAVIAIHLIVREIEGGRGNALAIDGSINRHARAGSEPGL